MSARSLQTGAAAWACADSPAVSGSAGRADFNVGTPYANVITRYDINEMTSPDEFYGFVSTAGRRENPQQENTRGPHCGG